MNRMAIMRDIRTNLAQLERRKDKLDARCIKELRLGIRHYRADRLIRAKWRLYRSYLRSSRLAEAGGERDLAAQIDEIAKCADRWVESASR